MIDFGHVKVIGLLLCAGLCCVQPLKAGDCEDANGVSSICGLSEPEDIVRAPGGGLVFGQMATPGGLFFLDTANHEVRTLFGADAPAQAVDPAWGDAACTAPPTELLAHGLHMGRLDTGEYRLLVVNHQGRESVEMFEFVPSAASVPAALIWRGCAEAPPEGYFNDVAGLPDGDFLVTHMMDRNSQFSSLLLTLLFGRDSGHVYRWSAAGGYRKLPGSEGRFPNGIAVASDGKTYFLNEYFGNAVRQHDMETGDIIARWDVAKPDNSDWTSDGKLWVASHTGSLLSYMRAVGDRDGSPSYLPFAVVEIDPDTRTQRVVLEREGPPMGAGTVAVEQGDAVYIGSFVGDRIIRVSLDQQ